jgi:hypothetical protein
MPWRHFVFPEGVTTQPLHAPSVSSLSLPFHGVQKEDKFQRRANTVNTSPHPSRAEFLNALNNESGKDAGGLDASIASCAATSGQEGAVCFYKVEDLDSKELALPWPAPPAGGPDPSPHRLVQRFLGCYTAGSLWGSDGAWHSVDESQ